MYSLWSMLWSSVLTCIKNEFEASWNYLNDKYLCCMLYLRVALRMPYPLVRYSPIRLLWLPMDLSTLNLRMMIFADKAVRDAFRRYMACQPEKWDYMSAGIPSALTEELEAAQLSKKVISRMSPGCWTCFGPLGCWNLHTVHRSS